MIILKDAGALQELLSSWLGQSQRPERWWGLLDQAFAEQPVEKWKPKDNERYFFVDNDGQVNDEEYLNDWEPSFERVKIGNCFQTREQAERAAEKIKELLLSL